MAETLETRPSVVESGLSRAPPLVPTVPSRPTGAKQTRSLRVSVQTSFDERRLFVLLPFCMIAGLIIYVMVPDAPHPAALAVSGVILSTALLLSRHRLGLFRGVVALSSVWVGLCLLPVHGAWTGTTMLGRPVFGEYQARVAEILSETVGEKRVIVSDITPLNGAREPGIRRARVLIRGGPDLAPGDIIEGPFRFAPVPAPVHPDAFDTQFHAYFDGIGSYGNSTRAPTVVSEGSGPGLDRFIDAIRRGIAARIDAVLEQPAAGIARAIITGDQSAVSDEARETMATAGIAHVLSVSGLHLTIVAGGVFWVVRLLLSGTEAIASRVSVKRIAAVGGIVAAVFYFAISGGNVAAFRSTLMILLVFGAVLFGRRALTMRNVAIAGVIVIATDPASVFRPSFQLSFAAVVALIGAYENLRSHREKNAGFFTHALGYAKGVAITSLVAGAATLVFSIYHFQQTSPLGVLGNLLSMPLVGFVMMPAAAAAVLLMPLGMEGLFVHAMAWSIDRMMEMAAIVADWSTHLQASPLLTPWAILIGLIALAWFAFLRDGWRLAGPLAAIPLVVLLAVDRPPDALIADTTQAMVVRGPSGLELASGRPGTFALQVWGETYAQALDTPIQQGCDAIACVGASSAGFTYAIITDPAGFAEECGAVDLVVTRMRAPSYCRAAALVDAEDLHSRGVHWLRWKPEAAAFEIRTSVSSLNRPWRVTP